METTSFPESYDPKLDDLLAGSFSNDGDFLNASPSLQPSPKVPVSLPLPSPAIPASPASSTLQSGSGPGSPIATLAPASCNCGQLQLYSNGLEAVLLYKPLTEEQRRCARVSLLIPLKGVVRIKYGNPQTVATHLRIYYQRSEETGESREEAVDIEIQPFSSESCHMYYCPRKEIMLRDALVPSRKGESLLVQLLQRGPDGAVKILQSDPAIDLRSQHSKLDNKRRNPELQRSTKRARAVPEDEA